MDPQIIFSKRLKFGKKKMDDFFNFYSSEVFPVLKNELNILNEPIHVIKPLKPRKKKNFRRPKTTSTVKVDLEIESRIMETEDVYCICRKPFVS